MTRPRTTITTWTSTNGTTLHLVRRSRSRSTQYLNQPGGLRVGLFGKHDGSGDDEVDVDAFNVVAGTADPQTPGDDCGGTSGQCPQNDEFDGTALDEQVGGRQPDPVASCTRRRRQPDADHRPGRRLRRQLHGPEHPPAGGARGPRGRPTTKLDHTAITVNGQAAGLVIYGQQNPNHFAKATLQFKTDVDPNTAGQPARQVDRADADHQRQPERQLRRQLPQQRGADAADERPVDPRALRRHEHHHRVLVRR